MRTCAVVLNYNDFTSTIKLVEKIMLYDSVYKVIIVDNNSSNDSLAQLSHLTLNDKIKILSSEENGGYSKGNNIGIKYAIQNYGPEFILICNPDILIEESSIIEMNNQLSILENVALITCTMKETNEITIPAYKSTGYFSELLRTSAILNRLFEKKILCYSNDYLQGYLSEVDVVQGSMFLIKSSVMVEIDFFDERTFLYCEEQILGSKLKKKGYKSIILNNFFYHHYHGSSINTSIKNNLAKYKINQKSKYIYIKYYLDSGYFRQVMFLFFTNLGIIERLLLHFVRTLQMKTKRRFIK